MAIKMRNNLNPDAVCCECGETQKQVLNMFDLCIADTVFTICDVCNEKIFNKCLRADVIKNGRAKSREDMAIIMKRERRSGLRSIRSAIAEVDIAEKSNDRL